MMQSAFSLLLLLAIVFAQGPSPSPGWIVSNSNDGIKLETTGCVEDNGWFYKTYDSAGWTQYSCTPGCSWCQSNQRYNWADYGSYSSAESVSIPANSAIDVYYEDNEVISIVRWKYSVREISDGSTTFHLILASPIRITSTPAITIKIKSFERLQWPWISSNFQVAGSNCQTTQGQTEINAFGACSNGRIRVCDTSALTASSDGRIFGSSWISTENVVSSYTPDVSYDSNGNAVIAGTEEGSNTVKLFASLAVLAIALLF